MEFILGAVFIIAMLVLLASDHKFWATVGTVLLVGYGVKVNWDTIHFDMPTFTTLGIYLAVFVGVGLLFSLLKWKMHTKNVARQFKAFIEKRSVRFEQAANDEVEAQKQRRGSEQTQSALEAAKNKGYLMARQGAADDFNRPSNIVQVKPEGLNAWTTDYDTWNLSQYVTSWVAFWPFYAVLLVLEDIVLELIDFFVNRFGRIFKLIANSSFADIQ